MPRARLLAAAVVIAATVFPVTVAGAATPAKKQSPLALATSNAARYWGAVPCQGQIKIAAQQKIPAGLQHDSDAWVTFSTSLGANDLAAPAAGYTGCTIALGRSRWPTAATMRQDWDLLCMTIVHEYGHLLGHEHTEGPRGIMAPAFTDYSSEPRLCRTNRPSNSPR
jgi:hypothetical protein